MLHFRQKDSLSFPLLLLRREIKDECQYPCFDRFSCQPLGEAIGSWSESDFLRHCVADYAQFQPAPRSTIALCYNSDGSLLASTQYVRLFLFSNRDFCFEMDFWVGIILFLNKIFTILELRLMIQS